MRLLRDHGADAGAVTGAGEMPLHILAVFGSGGGIVPCAKLLLDHMSAGVCTHTELWDSPSTMFARRGYGNIATLVLDAVTRCLVAQFYWAFDAVM